MTEFAIKMVATSTHFAWETEHIMVAARNSLSTAGDFVILMTCYIVAAGTIQRLQPGCCNIYIYICSIYPCQHNLVSCSFLQERRDDCHSIHHRRQHRRWRSNRYQKVLRARWKGHSQFEHFDCGSDWKFRHGQSLCRYEGRSLYFWTIESTVTFDLNYALKSRALSAFFCLVAYNTCLLDDFFVVSVPTRIGADSLWRYR